MGGKEAPAVFVSPESSTDLAEYIRSDPTGPFAKNKFSWPDQLSQQQEEKNTELHTKLSKHPWAEWDFHFSQREPFLLKADWHSVHSWGKEARVFAPRMNEVITAQRAPIRLIAFLEAFRKVNDNCWKSIQEGLNQLLQEPSKSPDRERLLRLLHEQFEKRCFFSAVEVQAGPSFQKKQMRRHKDGTTSLLHLGITLGGERRVEVSTHGSKYDVKMEAGHFYISSPFLYDHAVTYEVSQRGGGPILALMCRFGFLNETDALWVNHVRGPDMLQVAEIIAHALKDATDQKNLRLPSISEVKSMEERLK